MLQRLDDVNTIVAEIRYKNQPPYQVHLGDIPMTEKLEKFVEDVKFVYSI